MLFKQSRRGVKYQANKCSIQCSSKRGLEARGGFRNLKVKGLWGCNMDLGRFRFGLKQIKVGNLGTLGFGRTQGRPR